MHVISLCTHVPCTQWLQVHVISLCAWVEATSIPFICFVCHTGSWCFTTGFGCFPLYTVFLHTHSVTCPPSTQDFLSVCGGNLMCLVAQTCSLQYNTFYSKDQIFQNCVIQGVIFFAPNTCKLHDFGVHCSLHHDFTMINLERPLCTQHRTNTRA